MLTPWSPGNEVVSKAGRLLWKGKPDPWKFPFSHLACLTKGMGSDWDLRQVTLILLSHFPTCYLEIVSDLHPGDVLIKSDYRCERVSFQTFELLSRYYSMARGLCFSW